MIATLSGILAEAELTEIVIDVQGVGYAVSIPLSTFDRLPKTGEKVTLFTHLAVREDNLQLFGFATRQERMLFRILTSSVAGVGPKLALNVLSCISMEGFVAAVLSGDIKSLSKINGIGKRTAERIVVELKDKVNLFSPEGAVAAPAGPGAAADISLSQEETDAVAALETLGYKHEVAEKAVRHVLGRDHSRHPSTQELIRVALIQLNS